MPQLYAYWTCPITSFSPNQDYHIWGTEVGTLLPPKKSGNTDFSCLSPGPQLRKNLPLGLYTPESFFSHLTLQCPNYIICSSPQLGSESIMVLPGRISACRPWNLSKTSKPWVLPYQCSCAWSEPFLSTHQRPCVLMFWFPSSQYFGTWVNLVIAW